MHEQPEPAGSPRQQLEAAVKDLWSMLHDSGDDFVVFMDRRRMNTRVERTADGAYRVLWDDGDGGRVEYGRTFDNPREAAFHAYQGPH